jgi:hypothetical protein
LQIEELHSKTRLESIWPSGYELDKLYLRKLFPFEIALSCIMELGSLKQADSWLFPKIRKSMRNIPGV